jgi:hypothetical protein
MVFIVNFATGRKKPGNNYKCIFKRCTHKVKIKKNQICMRFEYETSRLKMLCESVASEKFTASQMIAR